MLLQTEKIILRAFNPQDLGSITAPMTDAETLKFTGFKKPQTTERISQLLEKWQQEGANPLGVWAVEDSKTKQFVGWAALRRTTSEVPELGYMIDRKLWGRGYATEIAAALIRHARDTLKLSRVVAVTSPENFASIKVLEKVGMKRFDHGPREDGDICFEINF